MKNRKILIIAIAIIVAVVGVICCWLRPDVTDEGVEVSSENQSDEQQLYIDTFAETHLMILTLIEVNEGFVECTPEQRLELVNAYIEIHISSADGNYTIWEDGIKKFNDSVRDIYGSTAKYHLIAEQKENRDPLAWYDGLMYFTMEYLVFRSDKISDEVLIDYLERNQDLYSNLSHEKVVELTDYLYNLLKESESDYDDTADDAIFTS